MVTLFRIPPPRSAFQVYDGEWCRNKLQGEGEYFSRDGRSYAGEWDEGKRHGRGMELQKNGDKYD